MAADNVKIWPEAEMVYGPAAVLGFFRRFLGTWEEYHVEVERSFIQLWTVRDGPVIRFRAYPDRASAESAARA